MKITWSEFGQVIFFVYLCTIIILKRYIMLANFKNYKKIKRIGAYTRNALVKAKANQLLLESTYEVFSEHEEANTPEIKQRLDTIRKALDSNKEAIARMEKSQINFEKSISLPRYIKSVLTQKYNDTINKFLMFLINHPNFIDYVVFGLILGFCLIVFNK